MKALNVSDLRCPKTGKSSFADQASAEEWMRSLWKRADRVKTPTKVYRCEHCGWWHMTSSHNVD